ncbi:MAG: ferrochelatase [Nitrosomonas sp.]|uniref:ferrochelatase n=1 Tax=Nitrosomonas sp. TaxID=42353 RepID=UPI002735CB72|nr:ferrochelatase [Nitrosomonas sp.]MDP1934274.1 ferrochelatase [Nitrosomonas sp.]MDP3279640.1 ferrochelatase [Nitrosomonas sp.]MDP3663815.1 ferrochelatase [Nitrosomonas sp.]MDZ4107224.1 ferrochelatase [Nitrosomonas sp.]
MTTKSIYQHGSPHRTGVLLINLGTPDAPTAQALRPYLKEFLSNPRVIEIPRLIWWPILHGFILPFRPKASAEKYAKIWMPEGSPLKVHTERQTTLLREALQTRLQNPPIVEYAMNIGKPSVATVMAKMQAQGCERILVIPLFPQYAASSTAAAMDNVFSVLNRMRNLPSIRTVKQYHDHPGYIAALAQNVRDYWDAHGRPDKLIISFHGTPRASLDKGDPYHCACQKTGRLLAEALALESSQYSVCFQSRFGRAKWLTPYTAATLEQLGKEQTQRVDVICPGFVSDCLETLEEIAIEAKNTFTQSGGKEFHYIPCLNERSDWIQALADITCTHLQGWLDMAVTEEAAQLSRKLALEMGAKD